MRYKRVFLVKPKYKGSYYGALHPPAGLGYIAESLARNSIEYDVADMSFKYSMNELLKRIRNFHPDLLGVTMMSFMHNDTYKLIKHIKQAIPNVDVVIGGAHASTFREKVLESVSEIDHCVTYEGDETIVELCSGKPLDEIKGLCYRTDEGEIVYNGDREFIRDLDAVPFPRYEKFELKKYVFNDIDIASSRGCPFRCIFCSVAAVAGRKLRVRSPENVLDEIEYWYKRGCRKFNFVDDNFTFYSDRVYEICDGIEKRGLKNLKFTCANGIRADKVDRQLLARMKKVGFYYIAFGVEGGNDKILSNLKKGERIEPIKQSIKDACDLGYEVMLFFLVGSPGETWEDFKDSVALAKEFPVMDVRFGNITPTPRSELFDWLVENNYFVQLSPDYLNTVTAWSDEPVYFTPEMSIGEIKRALRYGQRVRKMVLEKAFVRKMGRLGFMAKVTAPVVFSQYGMNIIMSSRLLLKLAEKIRRKRRG